MAAWRRASWGSNGTEGSSETGVVGEGEALGVKGVFEEPLRWELVSDTERTRRPVGLDGALGGNFGGSGGGVSWPSDSP
jgi:hypothetical protein